MGGEAGADSDVEGLVGGGDGSAAEHGADVGGDALGHGGVGLGEHEGKFVAADAGGQVAFAGGGGEGAAQGHEGCVAGLVAVGVVDGFEAVEVE